MTENILQKLELKMTSLLSELDRLRKETHCLKQECLTLKNEKEAILTKLQGLVSILDAPDTQHGFSHLPFVTNEKNENISL